MRERALTQQETVVLSHYAHALSLSGSDVFLLSSFIQEEKETCVCVCERVCVIHL